MGINWLRKTADRLLVLLAAAVLILGITSCGNNHPDLPTSSNKSNSVPTPVTKISEVSPPVGIQKLRQALESYQPQVSILNPKPDQVLEDTYISVRLQVKDLPIFKDANLGLGPHLQVLLDNQPYQAVYDTNQPLELSDLEPGTHTLRVFASRPWEESFKNEGAYAQTTFHVFTKTEDNNPDRNLPQLTYNQPQDTYGAEPIMLDFYLTNAPLHLAAQENSQDEILDWKIRATVNGESFTIDQWQPIYLKGFKPGKNWVQLEFIDERGNSVKNAFNNTVRLINYQPQGQDTLSKLVRGELTAASGGIVDRTYKPETPNPEPKPTPALETPNVKPSPAVVPETPVAKPSQEPKQAPEVAPIPVTEPKPTATPEIDTPKIVEQTPVTEPKPTATPEIDTPKIVEQTPVTEPKPTATPEIDTPKITEQTPVTEPKPTATPEIDTPKIAEQIPLSEPEPTATTEIDTPKINEQIPLTEPEPTATPEIDTPKITEPTPLTEPEPTATPEIDTPKITEPIPLSEPEPTATPEIDTPKITEPTPLTEPKSTPILQTVKQKISELMNKFRSFLNQLTEPKTPSLNL
ncbi:hypothetical protein [Microcoleus sp. CAWBG640]|uniref:hypothetical protein n=1 Tax=Microcoleus sp. CAWBG640 TaxID=2841653 RepID=UPI00312B41A0